MRTNVFALGFALAIATAGCQRLEEVPAGTVITCSTVADCPAGRVCNRNRCVSPAEVGSPPDLVGGTVAVIPGSGMAGTAFTITLEATKALEGPPRVILGLEPLKELSCSLTYGYRYACPYTATGTENDGQGGRVSIDVRMVDVSGNETPRNGVGALELDFAAPVLAARSAEPGVVPLGGVIQVFFSTDEDLEPAPAPVLLASRALGGETHFPLARQPGTRNYLFTYLVTGDEGAGPVEFTVQALTDTVGNTATAVPVGRVDLDPIPPTISSLAVTPARLSASGRLTVTFDTNEAVAPGTLAVVVGTWPLGCAPYSEASRSLSCSRDMVGTEIASGMEATQPVVVALADVAGNRATASGNAVFDFKAPALAARSASPANVPLGGTMLVTFTPDEDLGSSAVLVASRSLGGATRFPLAPQPGTRNYVFTYVVQQPDGTAAVDFSADLVDAVGNSTTAVPIGRITTDVDPVVITSLVVSPARIRSTGTLTVTFDTNEAAAAGAFAVTVGGRAMTCGAYAATSPRYTCTRAMVGNELAGGTEAAQSVVVAVADLAGNRTTASGSTVFDFRAPDLIAGSVALELTPPSGSLVSSITALRAGARIRVSFTADEPLAVSPVISTAPQALSFAVASRSGEFYVLEHQLDATSHPQGAYTLQVQLTDVAGNQALRTLTLPAPGLRVDTVAPTSPDVGTLSRIVYDRMPWGTSATSGAPVFRITGTAGAVEAGATVIALDGASTASAREVGRTVADASGAFGPLPLIPADRREVFVLAVDGAGNPSDADGAAAGVQAARVRDVTWTATLLGKVPGSNAENPHVLETRSRWLGALEQGASSEATLPASSRASLGWTLAASSDWVTGKVAYDTRRGRLVVPAVGYVSEWDGEVWTSIVTTGGPTNITALVYDARRAEVLAYDGWCGGGTTLWAWRGAAWEPRAQGASYTEWLYYGSPAPGPHFAASLVYDEARGEVILAPGAQAWISPYVCGDVAGRKDFGTYRWDGNAWHALPGGGADGRLLGYDAARAVVLRQDASGTQEWDGTSWTTVTVSDPEGDGNPTAASNSTGDTTFDPVRRRLVFQADGFVWSWSGNSWRREGTSAIGALFTDAAQGFALNLGTTGIQRWTGSAWVTQTAASVVPPTPVGAVYSTARGRMEAFDASGAVYRWSQGTWQPMTALGSPSTLSGAAYEPTSGNVIAYGTDDTTWTYNGLNWTAVTPGDTVRATGPGGMVTITGVGAVTLGANGRFWAWSTDRWVQRGAGYTSYPAFGPPALMAGGAGAYFAQQSPPNPDYRIVEWTPTGYQSAYWALGRGKVWPIAADAAGRTHVLQRDGTLRLSAGTVAPAQIEDPRGVGFPTRVNASAWDPGLSSVVVLSGTRTWQLESENRSHPGHLLRAAWPSGSGVGDDCFQPGSTCQLRSVDVSWRGIAAATEGASSSSATLSLWDGMRWVPVASASAGVGVQAFAAVSITDPDLLPRLAAGRSSEIDLAVVMTSAAAPSPLLRTDDVSVTVRYRLP